MVKKEKAPLFGDAQGGKVRLEIVNSRSTEVKVCLRRPAVDFTVPIGRLIMGDEL